MKKLILTIILSCLSFLNASNLQKTSVQLNWFDQFQFAGFYTAIEKGFYKEVGLDVELKKYDNSNVLEEIINKKADFGIGSSSLIADKSDGKDIVLLGALFQSSPIILLALKNSDINYIENIKNKKIMITKEQQDFATFKSMIISKGVNLSDLISLEHSFNVDDLINKNTDLMLAYITNEPFLLKEKGYESKIFKPKDYGFDFYEDIIFTTKEFASNNPDLVKNFYKATIMGWEYAFNHTDEIAKLIYEKYNPQNKSLESLIFEANEIKKLAFDKDGKIGTITQEKINLIINTYRVMGLIKNEINSEDFIYTKHLKDNFLLIQKNTPNLGIIEIVTRNIVASLLNFEDNQFISKQTFGFWAKTLDEEKIHNKIVNLDRLEFKKYSQFNKKDKLLNYQKVRIVYNLLTTVRNRAFHFENLYKLNQNFTPRISTKVGKTLVGIDPKNLEEFIIDILDCFDENLKKYIKKGG